MPASTPSPGLRARLLEGLLRAVARLPLRWLHALGSGLGRLADRLPNAERHTCRVNIELCFGDRPLAERRALARAALRESAKGLTELAVFWYRAPARNLALVREVQGAEVLEAARAGGRGVLILAPHHGAWELLQVWVAARMPLHALYRPPRQPYLEPILVGRRARTGARQWPAGTAGVRGLLRALRNNEAVGVLPDQQPPGEGVHAPFFGVPAKTMTLFCKLAARSRAPVVIAWAERLPRASGYRLHFCSVEEPVTDPDPLRAATAMNAAIERIVRERPEQYQWTYRRFSRPPAGETNPYKRWVSRDGWLSPRESAP
ncbi:LpxL/LpxP family acyltransferase [Spiribacter halobius]|uniref:Lipid A biosynthesis acyltransferase n=1 Tax=Sediminicurvatus halobius TaxID=2182432 RepID=A0A2U2N6S8_9GAMM|nr:lipid A biosynthesis acyltransferase [Spiribacter halobius]PWG64905.1 lipid A biosynthesis acyltransferase [Spiribacter halobius]UEX78238.1 lipid A biosynthesis acyltransferase [Spiribacter halobius]